MPEYAKRIYKSDWGQGYEILVDGRLWIRQGFKPYLSGHQPMTEAEANAIADATLAKLNNRRTEEEETELKMLIQKANSVTCPTCQKLVPLPSGTRIISATLNNLTPAEQYRVRELTRKGRPALTPEEVIQICETAQTM